MNNLEKIVEQAQTKTGITDLKEIFRGTYYSPTAVRNLIYSGIYKNKPAVLIAYDDPREIHPGPALQAFNQQNKSHILHAPELFDYQEITSQSGWALMEKLPENAQRFENQMDSTTRQEFLQLFLEYRQNFPTKSPIEPSLAEYLNAANFHVFRIARWFDLATKKDSTHFLQTGQHLTDPRQLSQKIQQSLIAIREIFMDRPMIWSHGNFKNHEIFKVNNQNYYLIDFAHTKLFPEGYELGHIIWADYLMSDNWKNLTSREWLAGIENWLKETVKIANILKYPQPQKLMIGCLLERTWGTILADVISSAMSLEEKQIRLKLLFQLVDYCLEEI